MIRRTIARVKRVSATAGLLHLWRLSAIKNVFRRNTLPDDQLDLLRSVLARAYEKRQGHPLRLPQALRDYICPRTPRKPIIESLNIIERKTDTS